MTKLDRVLVQVHAARIALARGVARSDKRRRDVVSLAMAFVADGMPASEAVDAAAVLVFRLYGQPPRSVP